jgi:CRP/FNR family transcriptional regulator, cyclic AMP receptor protein
MENASILPILQKIPLFQELNEDDHAELIKQITLNYFPAEHELFKEGDEGERLYIIKSGMVKIHHPDQVGEPIAVLSAGEFFGEMALFKDDPRNASATTTEESEIFQLEKSDFYELILKNDSIAGKLSEKFLKRAQQNQENASE